MNMKELAVGAGAAIIVGLAIIGANVVPLVLLAALAVVFFRVPAMRAAFTRQTFTASTLVAGVSFDDIGGQQTAKQELKEALDFMVRREQILMLGIRPLRGILLTGPPGTGKTLLARAAARHTGSAFLSASGSEFVEMYAGVGAQRIRELFTRARQAARQSPSDSTVIFIDEIEVIAGRRGRHSSHLEYDQTLNQLLVEMDGISTAARELVLVIAATNRVDLLDSALLRPGRFDRVVNVGMPDLTGRLHILKLHTRGKPIDPELDLQRISRETFGFSGAHLESLTNEAAILAMRQESAQITQEHFLEAIDKVAMGERLERRPSDDEMRRIAIHEIGHAIISEHVRPESVSSVTVASRGNALGYVRHNSPDDCHLQTAEDLLEEIEVLVAGSAAERLVFGDASTGSASDFERAVGLARRIVTAGLSELGVIDPDSLPDVVMHRTVQKIISNRLASVIVTLQGLRGTLESCATVLADSEKLDGGELRRLLSVQDSPDNGRVAAAH